MIAAEDYISKEFAQREKDGLWSRAWQMVGREEELGAPGDFITYEIADESITIVRGADEVIRAFYNVCPHRGRKLTAGCGRQGRFHCKYHGWKWNLEGKPVDVIDRDDWGSALQDADISLVPVNVDVWSGWIFVCMDQEGPTLKEWLDPVTTFIDPFDIGGMRYKWRRQVILPANWKVALEAFTEGYHVQTTHRQIIGYMEDYTYSRGEGLHGMFGYFPGRPVGVPSSRLPKDEAIDVRERIAEYMQELQETLDSTMTQHTLRAAKRLKDEVAADASPMEVLLKFGAFNREEHARAGVPWPEGLTPEHVVKAGTSWHVFPNMVFLHGAGQLLGYRARPNGNDPDTCIFDVYTLERYPDPAAAPPEVAFLPDFTSVEDWGLVLTQDFQNMEAVQQGMKSKGFKVARTNPKQEVAVSNFHRALREFLA